MSNSISVAPAVVLGLNPNGLGLVKSLVKERIPVVAIDEKPTHWSQTHIWMSARTRLCEKIFLKPGYGDDDLLAALISLRERTTGPIAVLPSGDAHVFFLAKYRPELGPRFRFHVPPESILNMLMHKGEFYDFCVANDIVAPRTIRHVGPATTVRQLAGLRFPCIVKPAFRDYRWNTQYPTVKAIVAHSAEDAVAFARDAAPFSNELLVQEITPGPDSELYFSHAYFLSDGKLAAIWTGRKLRQHPLGFGTSTLVETLWVQAIADSTAQLAQRLQLRGYVNVEFKRDRRDNTFRIIEVTPSRSWYPHFLGVAAGRNLPAIWFRDLIGQPFTDSTASPVPDHLVWVDEYRDVIAAMDGRRAGLLTFAQWLRSYRSVASFALFSARDPLPGIFVIIRLAISLMNQLSELAKRRTATR